MSRQQTRAARKVQIPIQTKLPRLDLLTIDWRGRQFHLPYLYRAGSGGPSILFVHGLGGAKENFYAAFQSPALADCTLVAFDQPGTGLATFDQDAGLDVGALADMANSVADQLLPDPYFLAGASMGGLINLLQLRRRGIARITGYINLEGNMTPEDCMFSRRVVAHDLSSFGPVFRQMMSELRASRYFGDQVIAHNLALNVDIRAYHAYSFDTVIESDSGRLLEEFLELPIPRLFLYGDANRALSYLPRLRASEVRVQEISSSSHFLFCDNPVETFQAVGEFVYKPTFNRARFGQNGKRAKSPGARTQGCAINGHVLTLLDNLTRKQERPERFMIKSKGRIIFLRADDIDWVETIGNYVRLHVGRESHLMRETMGGMEAKLEPQKFLRIHRSTIVNLDRVKELQPWAKGEYVVIMRDGVRLNMSRRYRERLHRF